MDSVVAIPVTDLEDRLGQLDAAWQLVEAKALRRQFQFKDFVEAMTFVNAVAALANQENHHPDIHIFYNRVVVELSTHSIGGLSENDFILARKIDAF